MASSLSHDGVLAVELPGAVLGVGHELAGLAVGSDGNARHASAVMAQVGGHGDPVRRAAMGGKEEAFAGSDARPNWVSGCLIALPAQAMCSHL